MIRKVLIVLALTCIIAPTYNPAALGALAASTAPAKSASLKITPDKGFIGGQALHWSGNIGVSGVRTIRMEKYLGREVDDWADVPDFKAETDATGEFAYWYPAPAMRQIEYRVVSSIYATPSIVPGAVQPDLILWVTGKDRDDPADIGTAVVGKPFGISVDTTPDLFKRPDTDGLQPIPGRVLTLERRVEGKGDKWVELDTTTVGDDGMGHFTAVTESQPGQVVYRVQEEDWFKGRNEIGWFPAFPTYVTISARGVEAGPAMAPPIAPIYRDEPSPAGVDAAGGTASQRYGWPPALFDFAWVQGESLTSPPYRGTQKKGWWLDYSDGGGRLSKDGGGLILDSKRVNDSGAGDFGTTKGTLRGNPINLGRWETRMSATAMESDHQDYRLRLELVPDKKPNNTCRTITVAEFTDHGNTMNFGVNAADNRWTGSYALGDVDHKTIAFAIEVTGDHITWFVNAEPIGTVKDKTAISGDPLTLRISMVGNGDREMNRTELKSDWQRGFSLARGQQVASGAPLTKSALGGC